MNMLQSVQTGLGNTSNSSPFKFQSIWDTYKTTPSTNQATMASNVLPTVNKVTSTYKDINSNFWDSIWGNTKQYMQDNPIATAQGVFNTVGSIWNGYQNWKNSRDMLDLTRDELAFKKEQYEANNKRAQEAFNMQKANWKGHSI